MPVSPVRRKNWKMPAAAAAVVLLLVAGFFVVRARRNSPAPAAPAAATAQLERSREEGKRLYESGRYEESLTVLSGVVARDPNDAEARRLVGLAETAWKGSQNQAAAAIASALEPARAAFAEQRFEDARDRAGEVLALDPQHAEATKLRDDSIARIALDLSQKAFASKKYEEARDRANEVLQIDAANAEAIRLRDDSAKRIDRAAAEKRKVDAELARIRAMPKGAPRVAEKMGPAAPAGLSQNPSAPTTATLRLLFESPISQGHVMVAVNDQILLRRPYSFKKKEGLFKTVEGTGTVSASIPVPTGPVTVKVWLSGPDIKPAFSTVTASMLPSETRVLKVDYSGGQLGVRVQ